MAGSRVSSRVFFRAGEEAKDRTNHLIALIRQWNPRTIGTHQKTQLYVGSRCPLEVLVTSQVTYIDALIQPLPCR